MLTKNAGGVPVASNNTIYIPWTLSKLIIYLRGNSSFVALGVRLGG